MNMSNLSNVKIGDRIYSIIHGWLGVINVDIENGKICCRIELDDEMPMVYIFMNGKYNVTDIYPTVFIEPPKFLEIFKTDDKVLVTNDDNSAAIWYRRYFSHYGENGEYYTFINGSDSWSVDKTVKGKNYTSEWKYCRQYV